MVTSHTGLQSILDRSRKIYQNLVQVAEKTHFLVSSEKWD